VAPAIVGDTLYFPSTVEVYQPTTGANFNTFKQSSLVALETATGSQLWSALFATDSDNSLNAERFNSAVVVADNIAFLRSNQTIYAFNAATGALLWRYSAGDPPNQNLAASLSGLPAPAVGGGAVYVVLGDGKLYAFNASDGKTLWPTPFAAAGDITTPPTIANGLVYTADTNGLGHIYALDTQTGHTRWKITLTTAASGTNSYGALTVSGLAVNNGAIYINTGFAIGDEPNFQSISSIAVTEARDAMSGVKQWSAIPAESLKFPDTYFSDAMLGSPLIVGDTVYAVTRFHPSNDYNQNIVFALDAATGKSKWAVEFAGEPGSDSLSAGVAGAAPSNLIASEDTLYVSSGANTLYAIALDS
jgi:outer membrane protein assembly factor BamB